MLFDPVLWVLGYLAVGSLIWALNDPRAHMDWTIHWYVRRLGRLPPLRIHVLATGFAILAWPGFVVSKVNEWRGVR